MSNYEICDGALLARKDILEESNQVKENVSCGIPLVCIFTMALYFTKYKAIARDVLWLI